jgi:hypothetical protein
LRIYGKTRFLGQVQLQRPASRWQCGSVQLRRAVRTCSRIFIELLTAFRAITRSITNSRWAKVRRWWQRIASRAWSCPPAPMRGAGRSFGTNSLANRWGDAGSGAARSQLPPQLWPYSFEIQVRRERFIDRDAQHFGEKRKIAVGHLQRRARPLRSLGGVTGKTKRALGRGVPAHPRLSAR